MAERLRYRPQVERADCGAACLAMVLDHYGRRVPLEDVRAVTGGGRDGTDARTLIEAGAWFGLDGRGVRAELDDLDALPFGSILFWDLSHFVVLERTGRTGATIVDPSVGRLRVERERLGRSFSGVALVFEPSAGFVPGGRRRFGLRRHVAPLLRERRTVGRIAFTSLLLRLLALALPLLTGALVDRIVPRDDRHLLGVLAACLAMMVAASVAATWVRSRFLLELRTRADQTMTLGFLEHLIALPYTFHLNRSAGDLMMRLRSNSMVREILTTSALSALLDGTFVGLYLILLIALSRPVAAVVGVIAVVQVLVLLVSRGPTQRLASEGLQSEAKTQSIAFQLLAGMGTIKAAGSEPYAVDRFDRVFTEELRVSWLRGRLAALVDALVGGLRLGAPLAVLSYAGLLVLDGRLSLGTALAVNALAVGFLDPLATLVSTGLSLQLLGSYLARLNDVLDSPVEQQDLAVTPAPRLKGRITAINVSFRYSPLAPLVLRGVNVRVLPGQKVALVGQSGSGKTTLAHLLVGLYPPAGGRILHDGHDLSSLSARSVRSQLGIVTQDPYLFGISIRENIAFNNPLASLEEIRLAARRARIADDIESLPLGYDTVLGDGGSSLSGGQRQRIAIARALAGRPRILVLDEATSHLDALTEAEVFRELATLECTVIVVAHRLSTVADADLLVVLRDGAVVETGSHDDLMRDAGHYAALVEGQTSAGRASRASGS